jgi:cyclopropane fatty-acyl-phospholipid synthase-like methyltransferase
MPDNGTEMTASAGMSGGLLDRNFYVSGEYLKTNPGWHLDEAPFKVGQILRMMHKHRLQPKTICDVGCGAGEVLKLLHDKMDETSSFWGYDISPQALEMCRSRACDRLQFKLGDVSHEEGAFFDLMLVLDVFEHVDDYIGFLAAIRPKSELTIFHIPLDLSVQTVLRRGGLLKRRELHRHLHYFTKETALETLKDSGYRLLDYFFTSHGIECGQHIGQKIARLPRRMCFALHQDLTVRILGGYSLLALAR